MRIANTVTIRRATGACLAALLLGLSCSWAVAAPRAGDRVLLLSTRPVGCTTSAEKLSLGAYAAELHAGGGCCDWQEAPAADLLGSLDPGKPIVFYVHGNQIDPGMARRRGLDVYRRFICCARDDRPIQFVTFSWCSAKVRGPLKDYRVKAARTRPVAAQLAWVIGRLPDKAAVGLIGYSYGARVSSGAAHLLEGGSLSGLRSPERLSEKRLRAVFLAAAFDAGWLGPACYHGRAMRSFESLLVTVNPCDPAMRFYKLVPRGSDPDALGGVGPICLSADYASRITKRRVSGSVGRSHDLYAYLASPGLMRTAWDRLTFSDSPYADRTADASPTDLRSR